MLVVLDGTEMGKVWFTKSVSPRVVKKSKLACLEDGWPDTRSNSVVSGKKRESKSIGRVWVLDSVGVRLAPKLCCSVRSPKMSIPKLSTVSTAALAVLTEGRLLLEAGMLATEREECGVEGTLNIAGVAGVTEDTLGGEGEMVP